MDSSYKIAMYLICLAFTTPISGTADSQQITVFPGLDWQQASPESQGVDSTKLKAAMDYLDAAYGSAGVSEAVVIRNGYMIWKGSNINARHTVHSCTKTFTSTVLGLLIDDGKCSLDTLAVQHLPSLDDQYPLYSKIKFRHLASMTSGYDGQKGESTPDKQWGDESKYLTPAAPLFAPGTAFKYHDPAIHLLGYIMTHIAGEPLEALFKRRIADPIGMTNWEWKDLGVVDGILLNSPSGIYNGGIHITARELARFGHLFLNRGNWNGAQLISASWVNQATTNQVPVSVDAPSYDGRGRYGFFWWTNGIKPNGKRPWPSAPPNTFAARGGSTNWCFVIPEWNMVVVRLEALPRLSLSGIEQIWDTFFGLVADALEADGSDATPAVSDDRK
ncbi:TPA: class C beta-lactamase-related serine hydrolase [Candidatus Poribacteria bacterium]|nr:class C beta-lactamase-related serine hydrolase [Candidatus Poribacteria bacterium]